MPERSHPCGDCQFLRREPRTDFYPPKEHFYCTLFAAPEWLGFAPIAPAWCLPVVERNVNMAKKRATAKKVKKKSSVPAAGQSNLPGVESDRDQELDLAMEEMAAAKRTAKAKANEYDDAVDKVGQLMERKGMHSYTCCGLVVTINEETKVKITKAK